jgi:uncharacterized membrane protein YfcA
VETVIHHPISLGIMGVLVGALGTLVGAGGGFLLVPLYLALFPGMDPEQVTAASLAVVAFNSSSGAVAYLRQGRTDTAMAFLLFASMLPGSVAGVLAVSLVPRQMFQQAFGVLLLLLGTYMVASAALRPRPQAAMALVREPIPCRSPLRIRAGMAASAGTGFVASFLGIGGGPFYVPLLIYVLRYPVLIATATSQVSLSFMAWVAVLAHFLKGTYFEVWWLVLPAAFGAAVGAQAGAKLSLRVKGTAIVLLLGVVLSLVAIRLIMYT